LNREERKEKRKGGKGGVKQSGRGNPLAACICREGRDDWTKRPLLNLVVRVNGWEGGTQN